MASEEVGANEESVVKMPVSFTVATPFYNRGLDYLCLRNDAQPVGSIPKSNTTCHAFLAHQF